MSDTFALAVWRLPGQVPKAWHLQTPFTLINRRSLPDVASKLDRSVHHRKYPYDPGYNIRGKGTHDHHHRREAFS
jgi:hypothetical protein